VSFVAQFNALPVGELLRRARGAPVSAARASLDRPSLSLTDFAHLISPAAGELLEAMGRRFISRMSASTTAGIAVFPGTTRFCG